MTTNQTIDGVSRKSLEQALKLAAVFDDSCDGADAESARGVVWILRALLDAPACSACNDTGQMHEPGCEPGACTACLEKPAAQPQPVARVEIGADRNAALTVTDDDWLRSLKDRGVHQIVSLYAEQPAPVAVVLPERSNQDYAIEHAEYMAKSADEVLAKFEAYGLALLAVDEGGDDGEGELLENIDSTRSDLQEALVDLRGMIYEFRKRAAKSR